MNSQNSPAATAKRIAAIDVGSNAIRMLIAETEGTQGEWKALKKLRSPVRLGHDVFSDGTISKATYLQMKETFLEFQKNLQLFKVEKYKAYATSAMRESKNQSEILAQLQKDTGTKLQTISGDTEGELICLALQKSLDLNKGHFLLIDIGGGSVELTILKNGARLKTKSFPIGTVRLLENAKKKGFNEKKIPILLTQHMNEISDFIFSNSQGFVFESAIGTGGNFESFLKISQEVLKTHHNYLQKKDVQNLFKILSDISAEERIRRFDIRKDRADVIIPALMITETIMTMSETNRLEVPCVGLRDGIIESLLG